MKTLLPSHCLLILALLASSPFQPAARAGEPPSLKVENPRVLAAPPVSAKTAAFMVPVNDGDRPVRLVSASRPSPGEQP